MSKPTTHEILAAIAESRHTDSTQTVLVDDLTDAYDTIHAVVECEIDSERREDEDGNITLIVWGWTAPGRPNEEADWTLRLTTA